MYEDWAEQFRVLGDATRLRILALLRVREACVCELAALLPVSQPAVSQHLRRLRQAGLVAVRRQQAWTFYRLRPDMPNHLREWLADVPVDAHDVEWLSTHHVGESCPEGLPASKAGPLSASEPARGVDA